MSALQGPEVFPVAPFEHFMLADDRPGHPMLFYLRFTFEGELDDERFLKALGAALTRHPLLRCRLSGDVEGPTRDLAWVLQPTLSLPFVDWENSSPDMTFRQVHPDLSRDAGVRFFVHGNEKKTRVLMEVHHGVSDALGAIRFFEDVMVYYSGDADALRPLDPEKLASRLTLGETTASLRKRLGRDLGRTWEFFRTRPQMLATSDRTHAEVDFLPAVDFRLSAEETSEFRDAARTKGATVNDLMLRDLFLTLDEWNRRLSKRRRIRIAVATNLRSGGDDDLPAANLVSMVFLDRKGREFDDSGRLLEGLVREMSYIKDFRIGFTLCRVAAWFGRIPGGLRWLMKPKRIFPCFSTAVLSNLGVPLAHWRLPQKGGRILCGGLTLDRLELLSPVRPGTAGAFGVATYAGRLSVTLHYDPERLSPSEADSLVDLFHKRISAHKAPSRPVAGPDFDKWSAVRRNLPPLRSLPLGKGVRPDSPPMPVPQALEAARNDEGERGETSPMRRRHARFPRDGADSKR